MAIFGSSWSEGEEDPWESLGIGFGSLKDPSLRDQFTSLTGESSQGLSKHQMIERLENNINLGYESLNTLGKMAELKSNIENSL